MKDNVSLRQALSCHLRGMKELHKVSPKFFPILTLYCIFNAGFPYVSVWFSARILQELATLRRAQILWTWVIAAVSCVGLASAAKALLYRRTDSLLSDLWGRKEILFIQKTFSLDFAELDKQENHDLRAQIKQSENWSGWGLMRIHQVFSLWLTGLIGLGSGIALTIPLFSAPVPPSAGRLTLLNSPWFILCFALVLLGVSMLAGRLSAAATKRWGSYGAEATFFNRLFTHFAILGLDNKRGPDIRLYNQQKLVKAYWSQDSAFGAKGSVAREAQGKTGIRAGLAAGLTALITGFVYVFTCLKAWGGAFDVGSVTQYVGAAAAMVSNVFSLTGLMGVLEANTPYLEKIFAFLDIPNAMYQGSLTTEKRSDRQYEVEFKDVSFKYPGSKIWALRHVNMKFKIGQRLAVVGENGSGKTTFIKLLCRLYDPQEGQILLNGIDIRKYRYDNYLQLFSIVFQDFKLLAQPLGNNVAGSLHYDRERARRVLQDAGFGERLATLDKGLDTMLYKNLSEDGVDISGGEAQKIALARALYKDAPFIILDEPTSALDPLAEAELYQKFDEVVGDRTAIYISHRLASCQFCDEIAVFHEGAVIQHDTHASLLADQDGKYAELWNAQAQYYV